MGNTGDEAILRGLQSVLGKIWADSEISVMGRGKLLPVGIRSFLKALVKPRLFLEPYRIIKSCDIFILGGGGLFTDEERPFVSLFWALHGYVAHLLKKKVLCLGISVGKISFFNRWFVKKVLKVAKIVMVRDQHSQRIMEKMGIKSYLGCDFASMNFKTLCHGELVEPCQTNKRILRQAHDDNYIVISARPFKNIDEKLYTILAQLCDTVIEKHGLAVKLIPFQKGEGNDSKILHKIFEQVRQKDKVKIENFYENINELMQTLANEQVVVSMRLHAGILSALTGTPFIPLNYMEKVSDFWEMFPDIKPIDINKINIDDLAERFQNIYSNGRNNKAVFEKISMDLRGKAQETEELLAKLLR